MRHQDPISRDKLTTSLRSSLKATFSPATAQLLQEVVNPAPDFGTIASIIRLDPALTTAILALVNSPYYGQAGKISDLQRAAILIGNNEILRIALSLSLQKSLGALLEKNGFNSFANWRVIIWAALGAELVAKAIAPREASNAYICTLVKDMSLLLYAASFPEQALSRLRQPDFVNTGPFSLNWEGLLPEDHSTLSADLLTEWKFPQHMITAVLAHHDLEHALDHPPLTQAVILGTRWAEVEFQADPSPDSLGHLSCLMAKAGALPKNGLEELRRQGMSLFAELCSAMNIKEVPSGELLFSHSLQSIQDFYFQTKEVEGLTGGSAAIALCIGRHLRWNWNYRQAEIILYSPSNRCWERFLLDGDELGPTEQAMSLEGFNPHAGLSFPLQIEGTILGELRLGEPREANPPKADMSLYARLLARSYWRHLNTVTPLEIKADLLDILPTGVALLDGEGRIVRVNPTFSSFVGGGQRLEGQLLHDVFPQDQFQKNKQHWLDFLHDPKQPTCCAVYCPLGPKTDAESPCFALSGYRIASGSSTSILGLIQDLTEIQVLEFEALHQRDFLVRLLGAMQDLVMTLDQQGTITFATGRHAPLLTGRNLFQITMPLTTHLGPWDMDALEQGGKAVEAQILLDGEHQQLEMIFARFTSGSDYGLVVGRNISTIRRLERKIREQAVFDSLTQVFNRHQLTPILEREISRSRRTNVPLGLIFFDIDGFKKFNDTYGHPGGDKALLELGRLLRNVLRKGFDFPCRFGGDEFVIVSGNSSRAALLTIAERVQAEFRRIHDSRITLSIGMSLLEPEDTDSSLLERCDKANYQAKARGGNAIVHLQTETLS